MFYDNCKPFMKKYRPFIENRNFGQKTRKSSKNVKKRPFSRKRRKTLVSSVFRKNAVFGLCKHELILTPFSDFGGFWGGPKNRQKTTKSSKFDQK